MIYYSQNGKHALDGELAQKILSNYEELKLSGASNIGWKMINEKFPQSHIMRFSTSVDPVILNIKFLEPQYIVDEEKNQ